MLVKIYHLESGVLLHAFDWVNLDSPPISQVKQPPQPPLASSQMKTSCELESYREVCHQVSPKM